MIGQLDSASLTEVVNYLRQPKSAYPWAQASIVNVTTLMINADGFRIAQNVSGKPGMPTSDYGHLMTGIAQYVKFVSVGEKQRLFALRETQSWAEANAAEVRSVVQSLTSGTYEENSWDGEYQQFPQWLETALIHNLPEHLLRLGGPFERQFTDQITTCLGLKEVDLQRLWLACEQNPNLAGQEGSMLDLLRDVFTCSSLLRGKYHDIRANKSKMQIAHHPFRRPLLETRLTDEGTQIYESSNTLQKLSDCIITYACKEGTLRRRIDRYVTYVARARQLQREGSIDLRPKESEAVLNDVSRKNAKKIGFELLTMRQQTALSTGLGLSTAFATSFVLAPWESFSVGAAATIAGNRREIGTLIKGPAGRLWQRRKP